MNTPEGTPPDPANDPESRTMDSIPRDRAIQRVTRGAAQRAARRLPTPSVRALARRALPVAASVATAAMATVAAERALSRAATKLLPAESPPAAEAPRRRRVVITERVQIERYRVRR